MVAYNFQPRFVPAIRSGLKRHTIRAERSGRSRHARPGELVQLYQGLRTDHAKLIAAPLCEAVWPVRLDLEGAVEIGIDHCLDLDAFAVADGFRGWSDLCAFWRKQHSGVVVFSGVMIRWAPIVVDVPAAEGVRRGGQMDLFPNPAGQAP